MQVKCTPRYENMLEGIRGLLKIRWVCMKESVLIIAHILIFPHLAREMMLERNEDEEMNTECEI